MHDTRRPGTLRRHLDRGGLHYPGTRSSGTDATVRPMDSDSDAILREPPMAGNERDTLLGALDRQRRYVAWKCGNLNSAGLRATLGPSAMTLGGLLKHLAAVEDDVFSVKLHGRDPHPPWDTVDWDADPDWEWRSAAGDSPAQLMSLWQEAVAAPAPLWPRRSPTAAWTGSPPTLGPTAGPPACGGS